MHKEDLKSRDCQEISAITCRQLATRNSEEPIFVALSAIMLFLVNLICINLAGTAVFISQGIKPSTWWEAKRARRETSIAILVWTVMLIILALIIQISQGEMTIEFLNRFQLPL